jgi:hypothetical protein
MTTPLPEVHVHVHIEGSVAGLDEIKESIVATKDEVLAQIAEVKALAVENLEDTQRVIDKLDEAIANSDLTLVAEAVADLRATTQTTNDAIEAAAPEPVVEPEPEPEPNPEPTA